MIGHRNGGLDDRILQVKGKAKQGALTRIWGLHGLAYETRTRMQNYQLFFLGHAD